MSQAHSISTRRPFGMSRVCKIWGAPRATVYRHRGPSAGAGVANAPRPPRRRGPYRKLRAEHYQRRKEITDRFDEKKKEIQCVKENVIEQFNERTKSREVDAALSRKPARANRSRDQGRSR